MKFLERATDMMALGSINLAPQFFISSQDAKIENAQNNTAAANFVQPPAPLGVLSSFTGTFQGKGGINMIFRPNNKGTQPFKNPVNPAPPTAPSENTLLINLISETLTFSSALGSVPNRGLGDQLDINLNGVPYLQAIDDITNSATGKADGTPGAIHAEPGVWMHVPATNNNPVLGESLVRMGSIPHGTTINAQTLSPTTNVSGPPNIQSVNITPFVIGSPNSLIKFASQNVSNTATPRIPQDLTKFNQAGTITQKILDDPNTVLRNANQGLKITNTVFFTVSTNNPPPLVGGGTANIAFLVTDGKNPNANVPSMNSTFWIETVAWTLTVPAMKKGTQKTLSPAPPSPNANVPSFSVTAPKDINAPTNITVSSTQIQYSQFVLLNFAGLSWPHVSVNTLAPNGTIVVPATAFN